MFKNYYKEGLILLLIIGIYFLIRLPNLTNQPVFADEAIYIRWAQVMKAEPTLRFLPLSDGKTPLFMWMMMPIFKIVEDPLLAGRLLGVLSGLGSLIGIFLIGTVFFSRRVGLFSVFIFALTPYIFFFDRMALVDSMLSMFTTWSIFFAFLLVKYQRIDLAMILGYFLGAGLLTKTPGMFNVLTMPIAILTLTGKATSRIKKVIKIFGLFVISIGVGLGIYNILRLGPGFTNLSARNQDYVRDPMDLLKNPFDPFMPHLGDILEWWPLLLGYPLIIAIALGIISGVLKKNRYLLSILLIGITPLIIQMALLRTFTARYMLFSIPPLILVAAFGIDSLILRLKRFQLPAILVTVVLFSFTGLSFAQKLVYDIENAPLPKNERRGYLEDWTAGTGLREIAAMLDKESKKGLIIIGTEGSFGTLPDGLQIYFDKNRNVVFKPGHSTVSAELRVEAKKLPTYYVANEARFPEFSEGVELIKRFPKAKPKDPIYKPDAMLLFKVNP